MFIPFPETPADALHIIAHAKFDPQDDMAEYGDNLLVKRNGSDYTIAEVTEDRGAIQTVVYRFEKV